MEKVDVVIAGAGIAGCLAARDLARAGRSVIIVERKQRAHLGHDWWDSVHEVVFQEVGMPAPRPPERMRHYTDLVVHTPLETTSIPVKYPDDKFQVDRKLLAQRQADYAEEAGARLIFGAAVKTPLLENDRVAGIIASGANGDMEIRAKLTIDATGFAAAVRRLLPESPFFPGRVARGDSFVTHREIRATQSDSKDNMVIFGKNNGVCWINRSQDGLVDVFAGALNYPGRVRPSAMVRELLARVPDAGELVRGGYGAPIPVRRCFDSFIGPGFILCGDSACQCNPIDGSGIVSSLRAASIAASVANSALDRGDTGVESLWPYVAKYKRTQGAKFVPFEAIQKFMISEPKGNLDTMFVRGIIGAGDFWGSGKTREQSSLDMIVKLLKLADRPGFILRLVRAMKTAKELAAHFQEFPETYSQESFKLWRDKTNMMMARIPRKYD